MIIAIDGTTGSGKSTISKELANQLDFAYVRTGSFYRAIALKMLKKGIDKQDIGAIRRMLVQTSIASEYRGGHFLVWLDGVDVSGEINSPKVSEYVSTISPIETIRAYVRKLQRNAAKTCKNIIMEGRDIGSVIFPDADLKVYVDCNLLVRARRRVRQYAQNGMTISIAEAKKQIEQRDKEDMTRLNSPLVRLPEAFYLDTTHMNVASCVEVLKNQAEFIMQHLKTKN